MSLVWVHYFSAACLLVQHYFYRTIIRGNGGGWNWLTAYLLVCLNATYHHGINCCEILWATISFATQLCWTGGEQNLYSYSTSTLFDRLPVCLPFRPQYWLGSYHGCRYDSQMRPHCFGVYWLWGLKYIDVCVGVSACGRIIFCMSLAGNY